MIQKSSIHGPALLLALLLGSTSSAATAAEPSVTLVLDASGSMAQEQRYERLVDSVAALLVSLPDGSQVAVVVFNHKARVLFPLTRLTKDNRAKLIEQVAAVRPDGGTEILAGVGKALDLLDAAPGFVVLVSDGLQTGLDDGPQPESVWAKPARALAARARVERCPITTIGLGPDVQADPLLQMLAEDSGGNFHPVRKPADLIPQFVDLASALGRFWRRSQPGTFRVDAPEFVVQVVAATAERQVFRESKTGTLVAVDPVLSVKRPGLRIERYWLTPGSYAFRPDATKHSDLLRPMAFDWRLPAEQTLPAGRTPAIAMQAKPTTAVPESLEDLVVSVEWQFGQAKETAITETPANKDGHFSLRPTTPAKLVPFGAVIEARQHGWHYRVGNWSGRLVPPPPLKITLKKPEGTPIALQSVGAKATVTLDAEVICETHDRAVELQLSTTDPRIRVEPESIRLLKPKQSLQITLSRRNESPDAPPQMDFSIRIAAKADDLVPPLVNDGVEVDWLLRWRHRRPALRLEGIAPDAVTSGKRGNDIAIPVALKATDFTPDQSPGVRLTLEKMPDGFRLDWQIRTGGAKKIVPALEPNTDAELRIEIGRDVMPGRHVLPFRVSSTDPAVPLNGSMQALRYRLTVDVAPVDINVCVIGDERPWSSIAPRAIQSRTVEVAITAADAGPLPMLTPTCLVDGPVTASLVSQVVDSPNRLRATFNLSLPAQTAPFAGSVRVGAVGSQVRCAVGSVFALEVRPVTLSVSIDAVQVPRYAGPFERLLGWTRPRAQFHPTVLIEGEGWEASGASWSIVARSPDGRELVLSPDDRGNIALVTGAVHELRFSSDYRWTTFVPANEFPLPVTQVVVPVPWYFWVVAAGSLSVLILACWPPWSVRVLVNGYEFYRRRFFALKLSRILDRPKLKLTLRRRLTGGTTLARGRRDSSGDVVIVHSQARGRVRLGAGESCLLHRGDVIEVLPSDAPGIRVDILSGRPTPKGSLVQAGFAVSQGEFSDVAPIAEHSVPSFSVTRGSRRAGNNSFQPRRK